MKLFKIISMVLSMTLCASVYADVKMWQLIGTAPVQSVTARRGATTVFNYSVYNVNSWYKGGVLWHQNQATSGNTFCGASVLFPQPTEINGSTVTFSNPTSAFGTCIGPGGPYTVDYNWPNTTWKSLSTNYGGNWSLSFTIPDTMKIGLNRVNVRAKACYMTSAYSYDPLSVITGWKDVCNSSWVSAEVTLPLNINIINQCRLSTPSLTFNHTVTKGVNSEDNLSSNNVQIQCDGETPIKLSFLGLSTVNGLENSTSLGGGWSSQLSTTIDGTTTTGDVSFTADNSKLITINSTLHGTKDADPGVYSSKSVVAVLSYN